MTYTYHVFDQLKDQSLSTHHSEKDAYKALKLLPKSTFVEYHPIKRTLPRFVVVPLPR
jgi:hypothetical protein